MARLSPGQPDVLQGKLQAQEGYEARYDDLLKEQAPVL